MFKRKDQILDKIYIKNGFIKTLDMTSTEFKGLVRFSLKYFNYIEFKNQKSAIKEDGGIE